MVNPYVLPTGRRAEPDRREFLGLVGAILASAAIPGASAGAAARLRKLGPIGLQLYTVRSDLKKDFAGTLARVARIGYREVEFAGYFAQAPKTISALLRQNALTATSAHIGFPVLGSQWDRTIDDALVIGHQYLICPSIDEKYRTVEGYKQVARLFNQAGERARRSGIQFGYHNHDYEFKRVGGQLPYDLLITETDPALVAMEMDVYWVRSGGGDPLDYFRRYPGRFSLLHIKDMDSSGKMVDVGKGVIDWRAILSRREAAGTRHIFVEHDEPKDPFASITESFRYLRSLEV